MMISGLLSLFAASSACQNGNFLGLIPWYHYLKASSFKPAPDCSIISFNVLPGANTPSDVPLVLLAIVDDLLRIAGLVAVAFVIVGAIQYITSQGNSDQTARARTTIINALSGAALATVAVGFVSYLGSQLGG